MTWKRWAAEAVKSGYQVGNLWEREFRRHLERHRPDLAKELGKELEAYCQVMTARAMASAEKLEDQGTPPQMARELARQELLGGESD